MIGLPESSRLKLGLHSRADLVRYALGRGWLQGA